MSGNERRSGRDIFLSLAVKLTELGGAAIRWSMAPDRFECVARASFNGEGPAIGPWSYGRMHLFFDRAK